MFRYSNSPYILSHKPSITSCVDRGHHEQRSFSQMRNCIAERHEMKWTDSMNFLGPLNRAQPHTRKKQTVEINKYQIEMT